MLEHLPDIIKRVLATYFAEKHDYADVTVTSLAYPPKAAALCQAKPRKVPLAQRMADNLLPILGTALHEWLDRRVRAEIFRDLALDKDQHWISEKKLIVPIPRTDLTTSSGSGSASDSEGIGKGATLGGTLDLYASEGEPTLYDHKLVNNFKLGKRLPANDSARLQLNAYRVLCRLSGLPEPTKLGIIQWSREWADPRKGCVKPMGYPLCVNWIEVDPNVDETMLFQLARERLPFMQQVRSGGYKAVQDVVEPCPPDHLNMWGVLQGGVSRRCMYCDGRYVCAQFDEMVKNTKWAAVNYEDDC